ncbi:zonular occludens toxin domain-containing protein [Paenibacillus thiaminolyticus]|uniref:zonular occludens toxin domain-containing protein n=1 Tax=Paenibacillus thiaminolyticus TaxID=49283 RepID=UPI003D2D3A8B
MIYQYIGTVGSGKSYCALDRIVEHLRKGLYVIANFPLHFTQKQIRKGYADRYMYLDGELLEDERGISIFLHLSEKYGFDEFKNKCLVVLDECGDIYPPDQSTSPTQRLWKDFFTQHRKYGYDFILIMQDEKAINRTIASCVEYKIIHRKANNIFPFSLLPFTIFVQVTHWKQSRQRLKAEHTIFVKGFAKMYETHRKFGKLRNVSSALDALVAAEFGVKFGNCKPQPEADAVPGGTAQAEGPGMVDATPAAAADEEAAS